MRKGFDFIAPARPRHWIKNFFVLAPLFFAGDVFDAVLITKALWAAVSFCMASSATYLVNDVIDMQRDRNHPQKRERPVASGKIRPKTALSGAAGLFLVSVGAASYFCNTSTAVIISAYMILMTGYSIYIKHIAVFDILCISSGFILRLLAGSAATGVHLSIWLIGCTFLLGLLVGAVKRRGELVLLGEIPPVQRPSLKKYNLRLLDLIISLAVAATIVCFVSYTAISQSIRAANPRWAVFSVLFVLYGVYRFLALVYFKKQGHDPVQLLWQDRPLQITCLGWVVTWLYLIYIA